jgi:enoyl-CoA hydratase/carnithine racemase
MFAAGADIKEMSGVGTVDMILRDSLKLWRARGTCPKPVIAAVSGLRWEAAAKLR